jgi:hypothetical protein
MRRKVTITIWDDLPIPKKIRTMPVKKHPLHPMLDQLNVGECFGWPTSMRETSVRLQSVIRRHEKSTEKKFKFRTIFSKPWSGQKTVFRIWRIK